MIVPQKAKQFHKNLKENKLKRFLILANVHGCNITNRIFVTSMFFEPIKCQCCPRIETILLICTANQLTGFYMKATLALNGLKFLKFSRTIFQRALGDHV